MGVTAKDKTAQADARNVSTSEIPKRLPSFQQVDLVCFSFSRKIQEEGLRTYLFTYANYYESLSLDKMSQLFEIPKAKVLSMMSKMIINDELQAYMDQATDTIIIHRREPSRLQVLALQLAEKAALLVENNERQSEHRMIRDGRIGKGKKNKKANTKTPNRRKKTK
jgi:hypothetical protein